MKKAQVSSTLSWFVATIVIFIILAIFLIFTSVKNINNKSKNIGASIDIVKTEAFLKQEQQRVMFVLFEEETENKKFYDLTENFVSKIKAGKKTVLKEENLKELIEKNKKINQCNIFFIIKNEISYVGDGFSGYSEGKANYYLKYPEEQLLKTKEEILSKIEDINYGFSFFFFQWPDILIKYYVEECENEE